MTKVPLLDLTRQYKAIQHEIKAAMDQVVESQRFILGPKVEELEQGIASYCGAKYAVGVSSGTDALLISLMAEGVGPGDIVVTTPYTFFATVGAIVRTGARPVFVDIRPDTYNMDPQKLDATISNMSEEERAHLKAIIPIHLYGQCADMAPIREVADRYDVVVIEDAAQAIGAEYQWPGEGTKRAGSMGEYGCFSFFPSKNLGAFGDGGMVVTSDEARYHLLKILRVHGAHPKYYHKVVGGNFRLDALQAAVLIVKLKYLDQWTQKRQENAQVYRKLMEEAGIEKVKLPLEKEARHIYNQFIIKVSRNDRDRLRDYLAENGIGTEVYYPVPLHMQECFGYLGYRPEDFPVSVEASQTTLALPIFPELKPEEISYTVEKLADFYKK